MFERILRQPVSWLLLICAVQFGVMLGGHSLWDVDEPNNAVCAREMLLAGNWWVPMFNGDLRFDKPILLYWLMMPLFHFFGINEWTARLPSALAITGLVITTFYFGRRISDARTGFLAALILATSLHIMIISHAATPDPLLMLCVGFALPAFLCFYLEGMRDRYLLYAAYIALGFGVLAKGPVAILLPALVMCMFLLLAGQRKQMGKFRPFTGLAIILAVALPWYIAVGILTDGRWLEGFLLHHNMDRFTQALQGHRGFPGFYLLTFILGWFPWSGILLTALAKGDWRLAKLRTDTPRLFMLCWMAVFVVFFTVARTRLPNYLLPAFPAAALLVAFWLRHAEEAYAKRRLIWTALVMSIIITAGIIIALYRKWPDEWMYGLCFAPLIMASIAMMRKTLSQGMLILATSMMVCLIMLTTWAVPGLEHHKAAPVLAKAADQAGFDSKQLATYHYFQPSLLFYHGGRLPMLRAMPDLIAWLNNGKAVVLPEQAVQDFPPDLRARILIHHRVYGLYARKWLLLISTSPI